MNIPIGSQVYFLERLLWKAKWDGCVVTAQTRDGDYRVKNKDGVDGVISHKSISYYRLPGKNPVFLNKEN